MSDSVETKKPQAPGLLRLPPEIRQKIYDCLFHKSIIRAKHGELQRRENFDPKYQLWLKKTQSITWTLPLAPLPAPKEKLNLVCRTLNAEVGRSWHSNATYIFPSLLSFVDILSRWSDRKISSAKRMIIYSHGICYNRQSDPPNPYNNNYIQPTDIPLLFPALNLDSLVIVNNWTQHTSGFENWVGLCHDIRELIKTFRGWKNLIYVVRGMDFRNRWFHDDWAEVFMTKEGPSGRGNACAAQAGKWEILKSSVISNGLQNPLEEMIGLDEEHDFVLHVRSSGVKAEKECRNCGKAPCKGLQKAKSEREAQLQVLVREWVEKRTGTNLGEWLLADGVFGYFDHEGYHKRPW